MKAKSLGFTLVELMVAMAIMGVLITIGVVSLNKFGSSQKMEEARDGLISALRLARNYAVTGQNKGIVNFRYVSFSVDTSGNVSIFSNTSPGNNYLIKDISPSGTMIDTGATLMFAAYDGKLVDSAGKPLSVGASFMISAGSGIEDPGGEGLIVNVSSSGLINE
jgi:prepilin-type N-terminal cleavage/methylation domain-containing protein